MAAARRYKTINEEAERRILETVRRYPSLGRKRLWALLVEEGVEVDPVELKRFLQERGISQAPPGPSPSRRAADPLTGLVPRFPDLGGRRRRKE